MTRSHCSSNQEGISLTEVLIAVAILGVVALVLSSVLVNTSRVSKHVGLDTDLITIKATTLNLLDCQATIGATNLCQPTDVFQPKMANGTLLFPPNASADWIVSGYCQNNRLLIKAVSAQKDPVSQKIVTVNDIYMGGSALCTAFFNPPPSGDPCQAAPQIKNGVTYNHSNGPNQPCCRYAPIMATDRNAVMPVCLANLEYVRNGSAACYVCSNYSGGNCISGLPVLPNTFGDPVNGYVFMHETWFDPGAAPGWDVDCEGISTWDNSIAQANLVCCPFN